MAEKKRQTRILITAPAPENIGGISMHVRRLMALLGDEYRFDIVDEGHKRWPGRFNLRSLNVFRYLAKMAKADIVHINSGEYRLRAAHIFVAKRIFRKKTIVTVHRDLKIEKNSKKTIRALSRCDKVIFTNPANMTDSIVEGARCQYINLPAFLPPIFADEPQLPAEITQIIADARAAGRKILLSNAWRLERKNNCDLYGLDMCIDAVVELAKRGLDYHLIFVIPDPSNNRPYIDDYMSRAKTAGVDAKITIWNTSLSFVRLIERADIVLRPTITDGDAISVREALYLGTPVVASDAAMRPQGTIIHKSRDMKSFIDGIISCNDVISSALNSVDYKQTYKEIYSI